MNELYGQKFILNGKIQPYDMFDHSLIYEGDSVYEVIRMIKGIPVFFHDHIDRLYNSVRYQGRDMLADKKVLRRAIIDLAKSEKKKETNLKIVFNYNNGTNNWLVYFIEPIYPTAEQYRIGVKGILFRAERKNPVSKVINHKLRSEIYHRLILEGAYEALLVNDQNMITEGSRSNIFFVSGETLVTAPDNLILNGITRKHILDICKQENITVETRSVIATEIASYESVFMTGTSPTVLPFYCIDHQMFGVDSQIIKKLRKLYIERTEDSMQQFRSEY